MSLKGKRIGFGFTGSHCTYEEVMPHLEKLIAEGAEVRPVVSYTVQSTNTRFGEGAEWIKKIEEITGFKAINSIVGAEPLGHGLLMIEMLSQHSFLFYQILEPLHWTHVKVGARRSEHIARITEMMFSPFHMQDIEKEVGNIDIVINTIPHLVVTANVIAKMPAHTLVIDLASKPGGTDFRYAEKRGVKALL
ncbi:flavoprotein, partial [Bacillus sp. SS-TM]